MPVSAAERRITQLSACELFGGTNFNSHWGFSFLERISQEPNTTAKLAQRLLLTGWTLHFKWVTCAEMGETQRRKFKARSIANQCLARVAGAMPLRLVLMLVFSFEAEQNSGNKGEVDVISAFVVTCRKGTVIHTPVPAA